MAEETQAGRDKRLVEQRDAQQQLQEPLEQGSPDWKTGTKWRGEELESTGQRKTMNATDQRG